MFFQTCPNLQFWEAIIIKDIVIAVINHTPLLANQIEHVVLGKFQLPIVLLVPFPMDR